MAEESSQEDRTEEATPYRLEEARRKGQVAQSKELTMALSAIAITVGFWLTGSFIIERTGRLMTYLLSESAVFNWTKHSVAWLLFGALKESCLIIAPNLPGPKTPLRAPSRSSFLRVKKKPPGSSTSKATLGAIPFFQLLTIMRLPCFDTR